MPADVTEAVGIRELRQNASRYVDAAASGRHVPVTKRGQVVAYLVPAEGSLGPLGQLAGAGLITPATEPGDVVDIEPVRPAPDGPSPSQALEQMRDDERW